MSPRTAGQQTAGIQLTNTARKVARRVFYFVTVAQLNLAGDLARRWQSACPRGGILKIRSERCPRRAGPSTLKTAKLRFAREENSPNSSNSSVSVPRRPGARRTRAGQRGGSRPRAAPPTGRGRTFPYRARRRENR